MSSEIITPQQVVSFDLNAFKKALLVGIYTGGTSKEECLEHLDELGRLCDTYGIEAGSKIPCSIKKFDAGTFIGEGKIEELKALASATGSDVIIFDEEISPRQQQNLEKLFALPVIDRTELIIGVFAKRAQTREAQLQIEMAKVKYEFPRLRRMWTHLSRQAGTSGGAHLKGEGEKQIEIDRRLLRKRLDRLKTELETVALHRHTQRSLRERTGIPTFAIVGYTNAGKSTLLKALTHADVLVEDKLFATLDTTTRKFALPNRQEILLIDTVGFIRKIPHTLVAAFRSTLEEAVHTDILLHLIDVSHANAEEHAEETLRVLKELGVDKQPIITVLNKVDLCTNPMRLLKFKTKYSRVVALSALKQEGFDELMEAMTRQVALLRTLVRCRIPQQKYALVAELMKEGNVVSCEYDENDVLLTVEVPKQLAHKVQPFLLDNDPAP